jgi:hypothetical protein
MMIRPFLRQRAKTPANLASRPPRRRAARATDLSAASGFPAISQRHAACDPAHAARLRSTVRPAPGYPRFLVFSTWLLLKEKARHTKAPRAFSRMVLQEVRFCCLHLPRTYGNSPLADDTNPNVRSCCYSSGVEHSLGKGEAESSNLSSSTIFLSLIEIVEGHHSDGVSPCMFRNARNDGSRSSDCRSEYIPS